MEVCTPQTTTNVPEVLPAGPKGQPAQPKEKKHTGVKRPRKDTETAKDETAANSAEPMEKSNEGPTVTNYLIVAKSVRTYLKGLPTACHCGADALPTLNTKVTELLMEASSRAHANGRKTIKSSDF
jgi:hypothetical protein